MNCGGFKKRLEEYLDGALSPWARKAADKHLASCGACRETVRRQERLASSFSGHLKESVSSLRLSPQAQARVLRAVIESEIPAGRAARPDWWFLRPVWASAATLGVLVFAVFVARHFGPAPIDSGRGAQGSALISTASLQGSIRVPTHVFHREGGFVIDTINYKAVTVDASVFARQRSASHH